MDHKEAIIQATITLIEQKSDCPNEITVREICKSAHVGLGLVNYHFGNKDKLIELCVERIINGIVAQFQQIKEQTEALTPLENLACLGNLTLDFLFAHPAISRISVLTDMQNPKANDNTHRTYAAYLPLVAACRTDWDEETVKRKTLCLITIMQQLFLRQEAISNMLGMDLSKAAIRRTFHTQILHDLLEV